MNGTVIPNTPIAVDFWKIREYPQARIFFLTHLHGDHIAGLTPSWNYPIYCSEVTANLLSHHHQIKDHLIHPLSLDTPHIIYLDSEHREQMTVMLFEANHCPGAVMFLFEGYFGRILHTGDFRFHKSMIEESALKNYKGKIDVLYLDNTYCAPTCCFPTRDEVTDDIINIIQSHPEHDIVIGLRSLGKETLLCKIAMTLKEWISVPSKFYESLQLLSAPNVFLNYEPDCRIRVEPFHKISNNFIEKLNNKARTIAILPTAIYCGIDARPFDNNDTVFVVPYSDHSSYTELVQFVSFLKPCKILPVVSGAARGPFGLSVSERANMSRFDKYLNVTTNSVSREVPDSVLRFMKGRAFVSLENVKKGVKRKVKTRLLSTGCVKKVKKGVEFEDSPEKSTGENAAGACEIGVEKENGVRNTALVSKTIESVDVAETDNKEVSNFNSNQATELISKVPDKDSEPDQVAKEDDANLISKLQITESQGFEYSSDNEEDNLLESIDDFAGVTNGQKRLETLDFNKADEINIHMQEEELRLIKLKEITDVNQDRESDSLLSSSITSVHESERYITPAVRKKLVKRPLDFITMSRKRGVHQADFSQESKGSKLSAVPACDVDFIVPENCSEDNGDCIEDETGATPCANNIVKKNKTKPDDSCLEVENCESQSLLCDLSDNMLKGMDKEKVVDIEKETIFNHNDTEYKGSEDVDRPDSLEESTTTLKGVSQGSDLSVVLISSDSEQTQPPDSQAIELVENTPEIVAELFDSAESSKPESQVQEFVNSEMSRIKTSALQNEMNTAENIRNEDNSTAFKNLSVIKWEPNFKRIRKQRFHGILTKFADHIKI